MTIQDYCQKMKSIADLLSNIDAPVDDRTLVMYLINGLNEKYDNIINVIKHREPFPSFNSAKSMLKMEESRLKKKNYSTASHSDHSSSSTALTVSAQNQSTSAQPQNRSFQGYQQQQCFGNNRGNRRY